MRDLYADVFKNYRLLPGELAKQSPFILFKMFDSMSEKTADETTDEVIKNNPGLSFFYGR